MKDQADYSKYKCPYSHIEKECGHELHGPEGYENVHSVWCACGYRGPVFCLDPKELGLESLEAVKTSHNTGVLSASQIADFEKVCISTIGPELGQKEHQERGDLKHALFS